MVVKMNQEQRAKRKTLMEHLAGVPDPRQKKGKRFEWCFLLEIICAALVSGQKSVRGIAEWAVLHAKELLKELKPAKGRIPSPSTFYRALRKLDIEVLEKGIAAYDQAIDEEDHTAGEVIGPEGQALRGQAVDGKRVRGASAHGEQVHLLSLVRHGSGTVMGQVRVDNKTNEIRAVPMLLEGRDLEGTVTTMDALLTQKTLAGQIVELGGEYLMVVKLNQPELYHAIEFLFASPPLPPDEEDRLAYTCSGKGHGRIERRTLESSELLSEYLDWPGVSQVMQRTCRRITIKTGEINEETTYGITSLNRNQALPPQLEAFWRGHWTIENKVHYVRDETMGEDRCQVHVGNGPQALAALRNGIISMLRYEGWQNIASALRYFGASVPRALKLIGAVAT
jgi:predicted transposase YbfD/YdcC